MSKRQRTMGGFAMTVDQPEHPSLWVDIWRSHPLRIYITGPELKTIQGWRPFKCTCSAYADHWAAPGCTCHREYFEPRPVRAAIGRFVLHRSMCCTLAECLAVRDAARLEYAAR